MGLFVSGAGLKKILRAWAFHPNWRCYLCGKEVFSADKLCEDCERALPRLETRTTCRHCGRETAKDTPVCDFCKERLTATYAMRSAFSYGGDVRLAIHRYKYERAEYLLDFFGDELYATYLRAGWEADACVFVPMTEKDLKKKTFHHNRKLAEAFAARAGLPVLDVLKKKRETPSQVGLGFYGRMKNISGAFSVKTRKAIKDKVLVLVDDVTTTGSTGEELATVLKRSGAKRVYLLTVASVAPSKGEQYGIDSVHFRQ